MTAIRIPDSTEDLVDIDPSARVIDKVPQWDGSKFVGSTIVSDKTYVHNQILPQSSWVITHNLGKYPSIITVDSSGRRVYGDEFYISVNQVRVDFSASFGGFAYLN